MAEEMPALVLHLASGGEPLLFALAPDDVDQLSKQLHLHVEHGSTQTVRTKDGMSVAVDFSHVAVAYIDDLQRKGKVFGLH